MAFDIFEPPPQFLVLHALHKASHLGLYGKPDVWPNAFAIEEIYVSHSSIKYLPADTQNLGTARVLYIVCINPLFKAARPLF